MKIKNNIGWCDATTNAVTGCQEVSDRCDNCYAKYSTRARVLRHGPLKIETWGPKGQRYPVKEFAVKVRALNKKWVCDKCHHASKIVDPEFIHAGCDFEGGCGGLLRPIRLFADSTSDWLDIKWSDETLATALQEWINATNLHIQLLTKRSQLFKKRMEVAYNWHFDHGDRNIAGKIRDWYVHGIAPRHIWIGASLTEKQDDCITNLLAIPAAVHFLSAEPLLQNTDLSMWLGVLGGNRSAAMKVDWVIVGGESGPKRRDCGVEAIKRVAEQCVASGVPVYVKQDVGHESGMQGRIPDQYWKLKQMPKV